MSPKNLAVVVRTNPSDHTKCVVDRAFVAARGDKVDFRFPEMPDAEIVFDGVSPFDLLTFKVGPQIVRPDAPAQKFNYTVRWAGGGEGNGGGEVHP
jgi:hypothetical protein